MTHLPHRRAEHGSNGQKNKSQSAAIRAHPCSKFACDAWVKSRVAHQPRLQRHKERLPCRPLLPGRVTATRPLHVVQRANMRREARIDHRARVRVIRPMQHEHRDVDCGKRGRIDAPACSRSMSAQVSSWARPARRGRGSPPARRRHSGEGGGIRYASPAYLAEGGEKGRNNLLLPFSPSPAKERCAFNERRSNKLPQARRPGRGG